MVSRVVRDHETGGSIPLTSTTRRTVHLGVMALLQSARGRFNPDVLYDDVSLAQQLVQSLDKRPTKVRFLHETRWASSSMENVCLISGMLRVRILRGLRSRCT